MRLLDLDPEWVTTDDGIRCPAPSFGEAQGIMFACPTCFRENGGLVGTHALLIWFNDRNTPAGKVPSARWTVAGGSSFDDLSLTPSINVMDEHWHGYVTNGEILP